MNNSYDTLYNSLGRRDQHALDASMDSLDPEEYQSTLDSINDCSIYRKLDPNQFKKITAAAMRGIKENKLTVSQYVSINIFRNATVALKSNLSKCFEHYRYVEEGKEIRVSFHYMHKMLQNLRGLPRKVYIINTEFNGVDSSVTQTVNNQKFKDCMLKLFFALDELEYEQFKNKLNLAPLSERRCIAFIAPTYGNWSALFFKICDLLKVFREQDFLVQASDGSLVEEKVLPIPTFSMFQAFLEVKGESRLIGRVVEMIPSFGKCPMDVFEKLKWNNKTPLVLYSPFESEEFVSFDGWVGESWLAGQFHDVYHAVREQEMDHTILKVRERLYKIAMAHPKNQNREGARPVSEKLVDGELIFTHPTVKRSPFKASICNQNISDLFNQLSVSNGLHVDLRHAFIQDMFDNKELWKKEFNLDSRDLQGCDLEYYNQICCQNPIEDEFRNRLDTLLDTLPRHEQRRLDKEFESIADADFSIDAITLADYRKRAIHGLLAQKKGLITFEQAITDQIFHLAIKDILFHPVIFTYHKRFQDGKLVEKKQSFSLNSSQCRKTPINTVGYDFETHDFVNCRKSNECSLILKKYFNLSDQEWSAFVALIQESPMSEQKYLLFELQSGEAWSDRVRTIQKSTGCFYDCNITFDVTTDEMEEESFEIKFVIVPSFTMMNAFLKIKGKQRETPISLQPRYGKSIAMSGYRKIVEGDFYPFPLYFPKTDPLLCCDKSDRDFISEGHEGPYTKILEAVYFALKESAISRNWNKARMRFVKIAESHPENQLKGHNYSAADALIAEMDWHSYQNADVPPKKFGDIFNIPLVKDHLAIVLLQEMIKDMVQNASLWKEEFGLGVEDLCPDEQKIYYDLQHRLSKN